MSQTRANQYRSNELRFAGSLAMDESGWKALCESAGGAVCSAGSGAASFAQVLADFEKSAEARERELLTLDCMLLRVLLLLLLCTLYGYSTSKVRV